MRRILFALCFLIVPAFSQGRQAIVYDMGPELTSSHTRTNGYPWRAYGLVYKRNTVRPSAPCEVPDAQAVGYYVIYGRSGNPAEHQGTYRVTLGEYPVQQSYYFDGIIVAQDEARQPLSTLFDVSRIEAGQIVAAGDAEFTPRSVGCFGGELKLFLQD